MSHVLTIDVKPHRQTGKPIVDLLLNRWSPRSMSGRVLSEAEILTLLEAARWAPSSYNEQPWRFLYVIPGDGDWPRFFNLLWPFNQAWAEKSGALILGLAKQTFTHNQKPNAHGAYDLGAAMQNLALQATQMGLVTHAIAGFDAVKAQADLAIPGDYQPVVMMAVGYPGAKDDLPTDLQSKETPSGRKPLSELAHHGANWVFGG